MERDVGEILSLSTMSLSTASSSGVPHAAPVYFVADRALRLFFFSDPESLHCRHLANNPLAAAAIYPECHGWQDIRGLQLHGEARRVQPGVEWESAWELYAAKFPFVSELRGEIERNVLYVFTSRWARLVDNRRGFGFKQEWNLP